MDNVCQDHNPVIITRGRKGAVVTMSLEDYSSLEETLYLMRSPANNRRLLEGIEGLKKGGGLKEELSEMLDQRD
jgi:antitoxin YefM